MCAANLTDEMMVCGHGRQIARVPLAVDPLTRGVTTQDFTKKPFRIARNGILSPSSLTLLRPENLLCAASNFRLVGAPAPNGTTPMLDAS
jgi:hypothetical protein